ncbi:MAG: stage III sporulation protein AB [Clostridiales bacterium]|nr:stage III sporulation protein AB [Clostridiales bacterium]
MRVAMKMCGLLCIFGACCLTGLEQERRLKQRWLFLREVREMLQFLEKEMTWHRTSLDDALRCAAVGCKTSLGAILLDCAEQVESRCGLSFQEIWRTNVSRDLSPGFLSDTEYQCFLELEMALCGADTVSQKTQLQKFEQRFLGFCESAHVEWKEKGALYRRLSAAAGVAAVILLV